MLAGDPRGDRPGDLADRRRSRPRAPTWCAGSFRGHRPCLLHRRHRPARRRQEHARRSHDDGDPRKPAQRVGVVAVDPTSPFTGGAILGDRVRMQAHAGDAGVFIRSMATRGHLGGLARATGEVALVLDASGKDVVLIETVGVGQDEVDIVRTADVSIVTLVPGAGDDVQALKAGIMEIADIFVVNKADRDGADRMVGVDRSDAVAADVRGRRSGVRRSSGPRRRQRKGVAELLDAVERFQAHSVAPRGERRRARAEYRVRELLSHQFLQHVEGRCSSAGEFAAVLDRIAARELDPYTAVDGIIRRALRRASAHGEPRGAGDRSHRHRGRRSRRGAPRSIATRSGLRSRRPRTSPRSACARTSFPPAARRSSCSRRPPMTRRSPSTSPSEGRAFITSRCASTTSSRR